MAVPWDNTTSMPSWDDILDVREQNEHEGGQVVWSPHTGRTIKYVMPSSRRVKIPPREERTCECDEDALVAVRITDNRPLLVLCVICDALHLTPRFETDPDAEDPPLAGMF